MKALRIVIILPLLNVKGGPQRFVIELAKGLARRNHIVYVYSFLPSQNVFEANIKYVATLSERSTVLLKTLIRLAKRILGVLQRKQRKLDPHIVGVPSSVFIVPILTLISYLNIRPQVILINSGHTFMGILKPFLKNAKVICFYHTHPASMDVSTKLIKKILYIVDKFTLLKCIPLTNSSYSSNRIRSVFGVRPSVLHLGVNISKFSTLKKKKGEKILFYLSAFRPHRRQIFLIELISKILRELKGVKLILAGRLDPGYEDYYLKLLNIIKKYNLSNNVEIYVNPSEGKVLELFSRATIYLNPALEHFGINILEAMAAGLPVIVYKEGGQLDFVRHGINGFIAGDNADEWVGYILQLLTDSKLYEKMAKATKETAIKFSWDRVAERFERLIQYFVKGTL